MRVPKIILLIWMGWSLSAIACQCREPVPQHFLHTVERSFAPPYVAIPQNAKGILLFSDVDQLDVNYIDTGISVVESVPPAVTAAQFSIVDTETGRSVEPIVTRLNVDRQMGWGEKQRYFYRTRYLGIFSTLHEVTATAKKAYGLFRVGPVGGFQSGRRYQFTYRPAPQRA